MSTRIVKPERETQNKAILLVLHALPAYSYGGNLADVENNNIREDELCTFLMEKQNCTDSEATEAINELKKSCRLWFVFRTF